MILSFAEECSVTECEVRAALVLMKWLAPAKINLSLRVLGRRPDGFHDIETFMVPLSLADEVVITRTDGREGQDGQAHIELVCSDPSLPTGPKNLAYRAAELFFAHTNQDVSVRIDLVKHVPHGAGLGGGSSDAATVLLALNEMFEAGLDRAALVQLAAQLGSDVPFFIGRGAAICRGRGEHVEPADFGASLPLLLLKPEFPVPTPWAYSRWRDAREVPGVQYTGQSFPWGELVNDLERPVFEKYLSLAAMKMWLLAQPEVAGALMSGSGSTVFAVLRESAAHDTAGLENRAREMFGHLWTCPCATVAPQLSSRTT